LEEIDAGSIGFQMNISVGRPPRPDVRMIQGRGFPADRRGVDLMETFPERGNRSNPAACFVALCHTDVLAPDRGIIRPSPPQTAVHAVGI